MNKLLFVLISVLLLSGCSKAGTLPPVTQPAEASTSGTCIQTLPPTEVSDGEQKDTSYFFLEECAEPVSGQEKLYRIDIKDIKELGAFSEIVLYKNYLAISHVEMTGGELQEETEQNQPVKTEMSILLLDLKNGETKKSSSFSNGPTHMQAAGDYLVLRSNEGGTIWMLDDDLSPVQKIKTKPSWNLNHVDWNGKHIYNASDSTILKVEIDGENSKPLLENCEYIGIEKYHNDGLTINYTRKDESLSHNIYLDLHSGEIKGIPFHGLPSKVECVNGLWLASDYSARKTYTLGRNEDPIVFEDNKSSYSLVDGIAPLCAMEYGEDGEQTIRFYQEDGGFYGSVYAAGEQGNIYSPLWCPQLNGYFMYQLAPGTDTFSLLFWDAGRPSEGTDLNGKRLSDMCPVGIKHWKDTNFHEWVQEIKEKYHIDVVLGDECPRDFQDFSVEPIMDSAQIRYALTEFEIALSAYPQNFTGQLTYGGFTEITACMVQNIHPLGAAASADKQAYAGFVSHQAPVNWMVLDGFGLTLRQTVFHELSHIIDEKLLHNSLNSKSLYSEAQWNSLNPPEFSYAWCYDHMPECVYGEGYDDYFIDEYARTFPTEDRARIMEYAMLEDTTRFAPEPMRKKLAYYSACIRDCFYSDGWGNETTWEKPLNGYRYQNGNSN